MDIKTERDLIEICLELIGNNDCLTALERDLCNSAQRKSTLCETTINTVRQRIQSGDDPLGELFSAIRSTSDRRASGAVYTPFAIVQSMLRWLSHQAKPDRIVDPGSGSGRFITEAARFFPDAALVAVEMDPLAALMLRANLQICGCASRTTVVVDDYRNIELTDINGVTAFIGNPPYVRHHDIGVQWKKWYSTSFAAFDIEASALAGLHLYFFLKTRLLSKIGDLGAFITSAEWLDVNYGSSLRKLFLDELGGLALHVLEPSVEAFPGTATTAAITCFRVGENRQTVKVRSVKTLPLMNSLSGGTEVLRSLLQEESKWSKIVRPSSHSDKGEIELGELFRVHRGQVTGANNVWIAGEQSKKLPKSVLFPSVTKARDLILAGENLSSSENLRCVIDIPADLDSFTKNELRHIEKYLSWARSEGADQTYIATHRKAWWSVGLKAPAPVLCTYMARRPPQFTLNSCGARHINIAHGLYPVENIDPLVLAEIIKWLNNNISTTNGRTYAGGLTKFEPKEIERLKIPHPESFNYAH